MSTQAQLLVALMGVIGLADCGGEVVGTEGPSEVTGENVTAGAATAATLGPDGVQRLYPTASGGSEFYLNPENPYQGGAFTSLASAQFNISFGTGSHLSFTRHTLGALV